MVRAIVVTLVACAACKSDKPARVDKPDPVAAPADPFAEIRWRMVDETIAARGVKDPAVLDAMRFVPRHEFVPPDIRHKAYEDSPLPIGFGLTISQPYIVATMTAAAKIGKGSKVLEIGTGSGDQAAVLAVLGAKVYTIEIYDGLAKRTRKVLSQLGFDDKIQLRVGDGYFGWPDAAPFDAILVTAAAPEIPTPLVSQLAIGGRMVIPVGDTEQMLQVVTRGPDGTTVDDLFGVLFGPMLGEAQNQGPREIR